LVIRSAAAAKRREGVPVFIVMGKKGGLESTEVPRFGPLLAGKGAAEGEGSRANSSNKGAGMLVSESQGRTHFAEKGPRR